MYQTILWILVVLISALFFSCYSRERLSFDEYRKSGGISYVKLQDGWTHYELSGNPESEHTVVLIHGGTIPLCIWEPQMDALRDAGFRVLRYDQYGKGFSSRPDGSYSRDLYARQLKNLLDSLQITTPVTLIGPSFGGAISVHFTARYPERVRSIVLVSPALNILDSDSPLTGPLRLLRIPCIGKTLYRLLIRRKIQERAMALIGAPCGEIFMSQFRCKGTERALFSQFRSDAYGDYREATRSAAAAIKDILLIRGTNDSDITEAMIAEARSNLPGCAFEELSGSGHNPGADMTEKFNRLLVDYIGSH